MMDPHDDRETLAARVRPMARADLEMVTELCAQLGYPAAPDQLAHRFELVLEQPQNALFVAEDTDGERVAGWVHVAGRIYLADEPFAQVAGIVVDERERSRGVGRALMMAAEAWATTHGYDEVRLWSNIVRERAHHFYEQLGYEHAKTSKVFRKVL